MENLKLRYRPSFDSPLIREELLRLLVPGVLNDIDLERRIARLEEMFRVYVTTYPYGLWEPGLVITDEMRGMTELFLPLAEMRMAFNRFFSLSLKFSPLYAASLMHTAVSWPDALRGLYPLVRDVNPARLLRSLMTDEDLRVRFIFSVFLPRRFGGGFGRYPGQRAFLKRRLQENRPRLRGSVRCLDAACGSGEGTFDLAMLLLESGFEANTFRVHGSTLEPLELFAAAHGFFPHDPQREAAYRRRVQPLFAWGAGERIVFTLDDITRPFSGEEEGYDVILCNGLLGGPLLHDKEELAKSVGILAERLKPGGIMLAADRFHGGWKKIVPEVLLREILLRTGLSLLPMEEGVGGIKQGRESGGRDRELSRKIPLPSSCLKTE